MSASNCHVRKAHDSAPTTTIQPQEANPLGTLMINCNVAMKNFRQLYSFAWVIVK